MLIIAGGLFGIGFGAVFPSLVLLLVQKTAESNRGTALSILTAAGDIGNALSTAILGVVAEHLGYPFLFSAVAVTLFMGTYGFYFIVSKKTPPLASGTEKSASLF
ncbi:MFS transporter [Sporomusa acidovorans]|uniref:MFS-type transporter YhhS n=1 Tax=Sporomusa acidovorans (strain ATCC 49682 / DSM 3132 / Mol) TaxID=1123286 RepID=A0ABZ3IXZ5_SPOA4|nr:MFS transporter [Sporomusa acidovorans]OZC23294.1 major facilitator superfamily transporter [Sporomusa acidovorans DSM 3132]SDE40936.1 Major Facilitator Superfamily protein [Sporomusa acidovorans]